MDWSAQIKEYRLVNGLKQGVLAEMLGVSRETVSRWENGREQPSLGARSQLSRLFATVPNEVIRGLIEHVETIDTLATLLDSEFRVIRISKRHQRMSGYDPSEIYGQPSERYWSEEMVKVIDKIGGLDSYRRLRIRRLDLKLPIARDPRELGYSGEHALYTVGSTITISAPDSPIAYLTTLRIEEGGEPSPPIIKCGDGEILLI